MIHHQFEALGTHWSISIDADLVPEKLWRLLEAKTDVFDQQFSRFISTSQAAEFVNSQPGTYQISSEFSRLLYFAQNLKNIANGVFDPAVGSLLETAGYDTQYTLRPKASVNEWKLPSWSVDENELTIGGPILFDIGGYGKGYWIDELANEIRKAGYEFFIVDGGGDMFGTTKRDHRPWQVAIEWPGKPEFALGTVQLTNQALAVSDVFKRRWGEWHHIVNPVTGKPLERIVGCAVLAESAEVADGLTTALVFVDRKVRKRLKEEFKIEYVMVEESDQVEASDGWSGELFV